MTLKQKRIIGWICVAIDIAIFYFSEWPAPTIKEAVGMAFVFTFFFAVAFAFLVLEGSS